MKVGINGFGRVGKNVYKTLVENGIEVPLINDPFVDVEYACYLIRYDTVSGKADCHVEGNSLVCKGMRTEVSQEMDVENIPWQRHGIDYVVEASGIFKSKESCEKHGCARVIITAPSTDVPMYVYGVNHTEIGDDKVISAASCTTNCLAPLAKILNDAFGIEEGLLTTVHSITASQKVADAKGPNRRLARSSANIIPSTTGAAMAVGRVIPQLDGKLNGLSFRVPVLDVSVIDFVVKLKKPTNIANILEKIKSAEMKTVIGVTEEELVSSDFIGDTRSSIVDAKACIEMSPTFFKIVSWYDNEYGYSCRIVDIIRYLSSRK